MKERCRKRTLGLVVPAVLLLAMSLPVEAQKRVVGEELAAMEAYGGSIVFRPSTSADLTLSIVGAGYRSRESFRGGQTPSFTPVDRRGFTLPDGIYTWELVENPRLPVTRTVARGKPANGRSTHQTAAPDGRRQTGSFSISNGRVVDSTLVEQNAGTPTGTDPFAAPEDLGVPHSDDSDSAALNGS